jgi:hypothetical protein
MKMIRLSYKVMRTQIRLQFYTGWNEFPISTISRLRIILHSLRSLPFLSESIACQEVSDNLRIISCIQLSISHRSVIAFTVYSFSEMRLTEKCIPCPEPGCE